ncbi:MAG: peptide chain release factor N(5)-glutamine methyltransferase [Gluconacetobacter diazotrophicus]|nr:peptide chain release factor N(5)-glutamine methyltransferase [Gluconacetobacter diazotrophicus]
MPEPSLPPTIGSLLAEARVAFAAAGIEEPDRDAAVLLRRLLGIDRLQLSLRRNEPVVDPGRFRNAIARRAAREPMALVLGTAGFRDLELAVSPATLIPRPDTETVVEAALQHLPGSRASVRRILDLGTGTGCLLLATLAECPAALGLGTDRSVEACALARRNAVAAGLADRCSFVCADWAAPLSGRYDLVLSNPPYIPSDAIPDLMPEVSRFEPRSALDGGADGLRCYATILPALPALLAPGGIAVLEIGQGQGRAVAVLARGAGLDLVESRPDLSGIPRAIVLRAPPGHAPAPDDLAPGRL